MKSWIVTVTIEETHVVEADDEEAAIETAEALTLGYVVHSVAVLDE